jgi:hypothetical protein
MKLRTIYVPCISFRLAASDCRNIWIGLTLIKQISLIINGNEFSTKEKNSTISIKLFLILLIIAIILMYSAFSGKTL